VHRLAARPDDVLEDGGLLLVIQELGGGEIRSADRLPCLVLEQDVDHPVRAGVGKRIEDDVPQHAVDDGDRADAERQGDDGDGGKPRRPHQRARAVGNVTPEIFDPRERSRVPLLLFRRLDAAERPPRGAVRLLGAQAAAGIVFLEEVQVAVDLLGELALRRTAAQQSHEPCGKSPEGRRRPVAGFTGHASGVNRVSTGVSSGVIWAWFAGRSSRFGG
jgi:hypothetical protein